jgi:hypothetical protein
MTLQKCEYIFYTFGLLRKYWHSYKFHRDLKLANTVTNMELLQTRFGLVIGYIEHLQIVTKGYYTAIANAHTLQFTTACTNIFQSAVCSPVVW